MINLEFGDNMLISEKPKTAGQKAILDRARYLTEYKWTPLKDIPTYNKTEGKIVLPAGEEVKGLIYSSTESIDKFIPENISFKTFLTIVANPDSALYNREIGPSGNGKSRAFFGIVCNSFVRYALDIIERVPCKRWFDIPGMRLVKNKGEYTAEDIKLCDILHVCGGGRSHVALITDILRNETGGIKEIEVSEAIYTSCVRRRWTVEGFFEKYDVFSLARYDFIDSVPQNNDGECLLMDCEEKKSPLIAVDFGDKTNYLASDEIVLSVFADGENEIELLKDGEKYKTYNSVGIDKWNEKLPRGYYKAVLTKTGDSVEFCVCEPKIEYSTENGILNVSVDSCDEKSKILHIDFRDICGAMVKYDNLNQEEIRSGKFSREIPEESASFKVYFKNDYAIWTDGLHKM